MWPRDRRWKPAQAGLFLTGSADTEDAAIVLRDRLRGQVRDNTAARTNVTRHCCVVRGGGRLDLFSWSGQMARASSVKAVIICGVGDFSVPSS
jgi:hypothetical protein